MLKRLEAIMLVDESGGLRSFPKEERDQGFFVRLCQ
jgi:hypothetical protein